MLQVDQKRRTDFDKMKFLKCFFNVRQSFPDFEIPLGGHIEKIVIIYFDIKDVFDENTLSMYPPPRFRTM